MEPNRSIPTNGPGPAWTEPDFLNRTGKTLKCAVQGVWRECSQRPLRSRFYQELLHQVTFNHVQFIFFIINLMTLMSYFA